MLRKVALAVATLTAVAVLEGCGHASMGLPGVAASEVASASASAPTAASQEPSLTGSQSAAAGSPSAAAGSPSAAAGSANQSAGSQSPSAGSPTAVAGSPSPSGPVAAATPIVLDCDTVLAAVWPPEAQVPAAPAWDGPRCVAEGGVRLTWLSVAGDATPESADAAFVELQKGFERSGWAVSVPRSEIDEANPGGERVAMCDIVSPGGAVRGAMIYRPMAVGRAMLVVSFQR